MQTIKSLIEGKELKIEICKICGQTFVSYGDCKPRTTQSYSCPECEKLLKRKITTYKRKTLKTKLVTKLFI